MLFHDDLYETMQGGKMGLTDKNLDDLALWLATTSNKSVPIPTEDALALIDECREYRRLQTATIKEDRTDYHVGVGKVQFIILDAPEFQITVFKELAFDVVVVTGITPETLKADPRSREALAQLLGVWRKPEDG